MEETEMTREEAIEVYRGLINTKIKEAFEFFAPELAESEDERIRTEIVDYFIKECECLLNDFRDKEDEKRLSFYNKALAYLEKQKEQEEIPLMNGDADLYFDEWNQQNQNPTKRQCFEEGIRYTQRLQEEQKQEWSEEDKRTIDTIVSVLGQYIDYKTVSGTGSGYATPRYTKEIAWLKSLRPSWKPSEEQEEPEYYQHFDPDC